MRQWGVHIMSTFCVGKKIKYIVINEIHMRNKYFYSGGKYGNKICRQNEEL